MVLDDWQTKQAEYDQHRRAGRYNRAYAEMLAADRGDLLHEEFLLAVVRFLMAFDMARAMGQSPEDLNEPASFIRLLRAKLEALQPMFMQIRENANVPQASVAVVYSALAEAGPTGLDARNRADARLRRQFRFDVGATKIMHAICPTKLFILDRYVAFSLQDHYPNPPWEYHNNHPIGHDVNKYRRGLEVARQEIIQTFGNAAAEDGIDGQPAFRIFDKCAWILGRAN